MRFLLLCKHVGVNPALSYTHMTRWKLRAEYGPFSFLLKSWVISFPHPHPIYYNHPVKRELAHLLEVICVKGSYISIATCGPISR